MFSGIASDAPVNCSWLLAAPLGGKVRLGFLRLLVPPWLGSVLVYDGSGQASPVLANISGSFSTADSVESTGPEMLVLFRARVPAFQCWEAQPAKTGCWGYPSCGYSCDGDWCAAMSDACDVGRCSCTSCAHSTTRGLVVDASSGRCAAQGFEAQYTLGSAPPFPTLPPTPTPTPWPTPAPLPQVAAVLVDNGATDAADAPDCGAASAAPCRTIGYGVRRAQPGGTVSVQGPGPYLGECVDERGIVISNSVSLAVVGLNASRGVAVGAPVIDCEGAGRAFTYGDGVAPTRPESQRDLTNGAPAAAAVVAAAEAVVAAIVA